MKQNVHNIERIVRVVVGLGIVSLVFVGPQTPWGWLGLVPVATGLLGWCPPYADRSPSRSVRYTVAP